MPPSSASATAQTALRDSRKRESQGTGLIPPRTKTRREADSTVSRVGEKQGIPPSSSALRARRPSKHKPKHKKVVDEETRKRNEAQRELGRKRREIRSKLTAMSGVAEVTHEMNAENKLTAGNLAISQPFSVDLAARATPVIQRCLRPRAFRLQPTADGKRLLAFVEFDNREACANLVAQGMTVAYEQIGFRLPRVEPMPVVSRFLRSVHFCDFAPSITAAEATEVGVALGAESSIFHKDIGKLVCVFGQTSESKAAVRNGHGLLLRGCPLVAVLPQVCGT